MGRLSSGQPQGSYQGEKTGNWKTSLCVNENKTELFHFFSKQLESCHVEGKELCSTYKEDCTQEEVDTCIKLHVLLALQSGCRRVMITINTNVVVLAVSKMQDVDVDVDEVWIAFHTDKHFRYLAIYEIASHLGLQKAKAFPMLHAVTGCDTVSFFSGKGKRSAWDTWSVFPQIMDVLAELSLQRSLPRTTCY